LKWNGQVFVP